DIGLHVPQPLDDRASDGSAQVRPERQAIAELLGDVPLRVMGNLQLGAACMWMGDYRRAEDRLLHVVKLLEGDLSRERFALAGSAAVAVRAYLTTVFAGQGKFEEGIAHGQERIRLAEALD